MLHFTPDDMVCGVRDGLAALLALFCPIKRD